MLDSASVVPLTISALGDWAGNSYATSGCPGTCTERIQDPSNFVVSICPRSMPCISILLDPRTECVVVDQFLEGLQKYQSFTSRRHQCCNLKYGIRTYDPFHSMFHDSYGGDARMNVLDTSHDVLCSFPRIVQQIDSHSTPELTHDIHTSHPLHLMYGYNVTTSSSR